MQYRIGEYTHRKKAREGGETYMEDHSEK
ncbi:uncharacterized protein G2W53_009060 [Senna tora]|uniref:Uncharacterized protein n=1 Tax=Senna tora TaxID=362788 RepID=A0A834WX99_9FABA|nr:uncharacterized protein G2W53_009060 [Senna tora]